MLLIFTQLCLWIIFKNKCSCIQYIALFYVQHKIFYLQIVGNQKNMRETRKLVQILLFCAVVLSAVETRKYDIEEEALKLYGEDLKSVMKRFRRTSDYLKILKDKMRELKDYLEDVLVQTLFHYDTKMLQKCSEMFPETKDVPNVGSAEERPAYRERLVMPSIKKFNFFDSLEFRAHKTDSVNQTPVEALDAYYQTSSVVTLHERNMFRDLGFEYAGRIIESTIKSMGCDDYFIKSTKLPFGGTDSRHYIVSTSDHSMIPHQISTIAPETPQDDTFKYKYRAPRIVRQYF